MKRKEFIKEISNLDVGALKDRAKQLAEECMRLRFKLSARQLEKSSALKDAKRSLARVQTVIRQKAQKA
jgi:large subunit ribosomal protein L29